MTPFVCLPFPFLDFVALSFRSPAEADAALARLQAAARLDSIEFSNCDAYGLSASIIGASRTAETPSPVLLSGMMIDGKRLRLGPEEAAPTFADGIPGAIVGQCSFVAPRRDGIWAGTDLFGHGMIFASEHDTVSILSNRSHLHALVLQALGRPLSLNRQVADIFMLGTSPMLSQQASTSAALTAGVRLVKPDETVTLFNGRLLTRPNRAFLRLFGRPHAEYDALLDDGIDELIASCSAVIDDQRFSKVVVDLSGGKDSRMVFGAMLQHPRWRERCHLRTVHTPRSSDLRIACGIANMFGADFDDSTPVATHPRSATDNLDFWRSYFHGQYHRMGAGPWSHLGKNLATINLSGGSGEMLRGFWSYQFARQLAEVDSLPALCDRIVNYRATPEAAATVEPCARALEQELSVLPADSLADRLDLHYVYFRNRTHFGMRGLSFMSQQLTWFPLLSPSLVAAAWCLPTDERGGNKVIRDVLHALHPALATIPFDGGRDALVRLDPPFAMNSHAMRWIDAEARRLSAERSSRQPQEGQLLWGTWPNHVMKAAEECALSLRSAGADYTKHLERARARIGELPQTAFETASKLFAMRDAVAP